VQGRQDEEAYAGGAGSAEVDTGRFKPDKGFTGADYGAAAAAAAAGGERGAVQFERDAVEEADPFGLDAFLTDVKAGRKKGALEDIGKAGSMRAAAGGGSYDQATGGSGRRMDFQRGGR
jgi:SNW domain-containing protein 1